MIKMLVRLAIVVVIGLLGYNYFFGTTEEKESAQETINSIKDLFGQLWALLISEKEKFSEGKYDEALDNVGDLFSRLEERAARTDDPQLLERLDELEARRREISRQVASKRLPESYEDGQQRAARGTDEVTEAEHRDLQEDFNALLDDTKTLMDDIEKETR